MCPVVCQTSWINVETDGRRITQEGDPPGQRSVYILPGNSARETYRLSTFQHFPSTAPVDARRLAAHGFYYTGYRDRVKCFSCGQCVEQWMENDDPTLVHWHQNDCQLANETDETNVPIMSILERRGVAPDSLTRNQHVSQPTLSSSQFENTQNRTTHQPSTHPLYDETSQQNNPVVSPSGHFTFQANRHNLALDSQQQLRTAQTPRYRNLFPCSNPVNPHMRSEESRLQTFLDHSSSWPAHRIRATPRQIANAGMYYLGVRDRVKCWYCNGGLQNWERDDDPWEEHAKWFPLCEFTLQQRGPDFVHSMVSRFPNLRRPILRNPANPLQLRRSTENNTRGPEIIDPRNEARSLERKIDEEMSSSELVEQARLMGFDERIIRISLKRKYEATGNGFSRLETLVESILAMEEISASNRCEEGGSAFATNEATPSTSTRNLSTTSGLQEIRRLQEERLCKVCGNEQASVVLIPCGHIACCVGCAENASTCPICRLRVREKIRSFIV
ncbi:unnamed protein product [Clavelina lepadiformis]|uniref:RING-type domain-containing protein n=1 Tax=Clavelina lepadiformis TaxID=159417 RepID=A0ABP0G8C5_CLALP